MNISCFLGVWFPIWLRPDNGDIAVTHSLRSLASVSPNQISLVGLFIIASSDCEWCSANGFSIQICWLDETESQQGLSFLWRWQRLQSSVNKRGMTLLKHAFMAHLYLHLVGFVLILKVWKWKGEEERKKDRQEERKKESKKERKERCPSLHSSVNVSICHFFFRGDRMKKNHDSPDESQEMKKTKHQTEKPLRRRGEHMHTNEAMWCWMTVMVMTIIIRHKPTAARNSVFRLLLLFFFFFTTAPAPWGFSGHWAGPRALLFLYDLQWWQDRKLQDSC